MSGTLALVGGREFTDGCTFDADLLEVAGTDEVLVLPTAAAFEHPERSVEAATKWFDRLGAKAVGLDVLGRPDARDAAKVARVRAARFVYLTGGSPMHLRSVLKETPMWEALRDLWHGGGVLAAAGAGAMALCDPMVDPRGGAFTLGLGLIERLAFIAAANTWSADRLHRTLQLAGGDLPVLTVDEGSAAIRTADGWRAAGAGDVVVHIGGRPVGLDRLP